MTSPNANLALLFYQCIESGSLIDLDTILAPQREEIFTVYPEQPLGFKGYEPVAQAFKSAFPDEQFQIEDQIRPQFL